MMGMDENSIAKDSQAIPACILEARRQLDEIDRALISLLAKRRALVMELFKEKQRLGIERFDLAREEGLIAERRAQAEREGLPGQMGEDFFRMVLEYNRI